MRLTESDGPTRTELADALEIIMASPKVAALEIADINPVTLTGSWFKRPLL